MKKICSLIFSLALIMLNFLAIVPEAHADTNNFYFSDATFDYYLKKTETGSEMEVIETLTAEFPNYNQNHGIERKIPFTNQDDTNLTIESLDNFRVEVTRNGEREPFTIKDYDSYFTVRIGNPDEYVKGTQKYVLKYKFVNVITNFESSFYAENPYQELYWDSNGTGWSQSFKKVTVNLHFDDSIKDSINRNLETSSKANYHNKAYIHENNKTEDKLAAWCYVGRQGSNNQDRCEITNLNDGIKFEAEDLSRSENLSFVVNFNDGTFIVPKNEFVKKLNYKDITIDYYLEKDENGVSKMHVKENFTVLFPTAKSFRTFQREIPFVNSTKKSFTTESQETIDIKATMDGKSISPSYIYTDEDGYFNISYGNYSEYLHGEHNFILEYDLKNVITENNLAQQLWSLPLETIFFEISNITVNLHIDKSILPSVRESTITDEKTNEKIKVPAYCKNLARKTVGKQSCRTIENNDGFTFKLSNVTGGDVFAYFIDFDKGTFTIPPENKNYLIWHIFVVFVIIMTVIVVTFFYRNYKNINQKIKYLRSLPIVPQYTPYKDLKVAEIAENYLKPTKNAKVATLLELIVDKKIKLRKGERKKFSRKYDWYITVINMDNLSECQKNFLKIFNNGKDIVVGKEVKIERHGYSRSLEDAFNDFSKSTKRTLYAKKYYEMATKREKKKETISPGTAILKFFGILFCIYFGIFITIVSFSTIAEKYVELTNFTPFSVYEGQFLIPIMTVSALVIFSLLPIASIFLEKYDRHTEKGLEVSRYTDGLKLYIKMAEADRLKFLQSVEGVDTSEAGIAKINEKLLPYAVLFGLEKSWMNELSNYYELENKNTPNWYSSDFNFVAIGSAIRSATHRPIDTSSSHSSGGSWGGGFSSSSSSSGGGGGGFSGGGGGGGGGGGW